MLNRQFIILCFVKSGGKGIEFLSIVQIFGTFFFGKTYKKLVFIDKNIEKSHFFAKKLASYVNKPYICPR